MSLDLVLMAAFLSAASGLPGLCLSRAHAWGQRTATATMAVAALLGLAGAATGLRPGQGADGRLLFPLPEGSPVGLDALSAFFLVPIFLIGGLGAVYGTGYWSPSRHPESGRRLRLFWGTLISGMALLVVSRHALPFLLGWEMMALSGFFLVATEDHDAECRRAGWIYLIATHVATLALFALFGLWRQTTGSFALRPVEAGAVPFGTMTGMFLLALLGFGLKAGLMPLHFWLPGAHANAPSHVSAVLSGVVIKMGIYGLVRFLSLVSDPPAAWGGMVLLAGAVSGLLGVALAIGQHDLKRLLAYHSVENIGIILMGLGLATLGRSAGREAWVVLGLSCCLLHVWNHGLFKALLFLCAGAVVSTTGTREIDRLGGLGRRMPWTAFMFLVGAVAICGLPPLNGFVSEWFAYLGLVRTLEAGGGASAAALAAPVLATIGALAVACFVKVYGAVFLGTPRAGLAAGASEAPFSMRWPMGVLAAGCVVIGLWPAGVAPLLDAAVAASAGPMLRGTRIEDLAPLETIGWMALALLALVAAAALPAWAWGRAARGAVTWDCGYAAPPARAQYTASSFAQSIVGLCSVVLRPQVHLPRIEGPFPQLSDMTTHVGDVMLDRLLVPAGKDTRRWLGWFRRFQQGMTQHYVLYIFVAVVALLATLVPFQTLLIQLLSR